MHILANCCIINRQCALAPFVYEGAQMKVSAIHMIRNNQCKDNNCNTFRQNFSNNTAISNKNLDNNDIFVRLAAASTRDARIEKELYEMGLI